MGRYLACALAISCLLLTSGSALPSSSASFSAVEEPQPEAVELMPFWSDHSGQDGAEFGTTLTTGDLNGDGRADLIVGAPRYDVGDRDIGLNNDGRVFVYLSFSGGPSSSPSYTLDYTEHSPSGFGSALASGGDLFGNGADDLLVGVPRSGRGLGDPIPGRGRVYLYRATSRTPSWIGVGTEDDQAYGHEVSFVGDVNSDGYDDFLVGDPFYSKDFPNEGRVFLYFGSPFGPPDEADQVIVGGAAEIRFGSAISPAGDVNHDDYADVLIGAPAGLVTSDPGQAFLFLGSPGGLQLQPGWNGTGTAILNVGRELASAGDVNGDSHPDVLVGGHWFGVATARLFLGTGSGLEPSAAWSVEGGIRGFGSSLRRGDFNGDGYSDVALAGAGGTGNAGKVFVYVGSPNGLNSVPGWQVTGAAADAFGASVSLDDLDGDGSADVAAGAPNFGTNLPMEGAAFAYRGMSGSPLDVLDPMCSAASECSGPYLFKQQDGRIFIKSDPSLLAGASVRRTAVVTDGVTRLLLRQKIDSAVTFRVLDPQGSLASPAYGHLRSLDGISIGQSITVEPLGDPPDQYVFAEYRAPHDFPGTPEEVGTGVVVTLEGDSAQADNRVPLALVPPPIVLVHGIWSYPSVWTESLGFGGLRRFLRDRGYVVCPDCLVDYRGANSAASFDPWADTPEDQFAVRDLIVKIESAREWLRARDTAVTQVNVVAHSLGALMARSRVAYKQWPYRRFLTYGQGDFHKLITIGAPHRGTPVARTFLTHRCEPFVWGPTLREAFEKSGRPFGPAVFQLQPGSEALRRIGATASFIQAWTSPIVGIEPASTVGCTESCTEDRYNEILRVVGQGETIDTVLGGEGAHDTLVPIFSQRGGLSDPVPEVLDVVHTDASPYNQDTGELQSEEVWMRVEDLLQAPLTSFHGLPGYTIANDVIRDEPCPAAPATSAEAATTAVISLLPAAGTVVNPGDTINVQFEIQDGNPVDGAGFAIGDRLHFIDGLGPFAFSIQAPGEVLGELSIHAGTFGPGPEIYRASTYVVISPEQPPASLSVSPVHLTFVRLGELQGLTVRGLYPDGSEVDVTSPTSGTVYAVASGTADVVAVSPEGLIQAMGAGEDQIVVSSFGKSVQVPVEVRLSNLPAVISAPASVSVELEQTLQVPISATDPEGGPITIGVEGLPSFATFTDLGGGSGQIDLQPQLVNLGTYTALITATDEGVPALGSTARLTIEVVPCQLPLPGRPTLSLVGTTLSWTPVENAIAYDVVAGFVDVLNSSGGDFSVSTAACYVNDRTTTSVFFSGTPSPGTALWFLVRSVGCTGNGSYDAPLPNFQVTSRDPGIAASPIHCP